MAVSIPLTATTDQYAPFPPAAVFDQGGTPYTTGYLWVQNAGAFISLKVGAQQGASNWGPDFPTGPSLVPLVGGAGTYARPNGPDRIFGVRARSLAAGVPAVVYGGLFQDGEAAVIPSTQADGTITAGGVITPPGGGGVNGLVNSDGTVAFGSGFTSVRTSPGRYTVTFSTAFGPLPVLLVSAIQSFASVPVVYIVSNPSSSGFDVAITDESGGGQADNAFYFSAFAPT